MLFFLFMEGIGGAAKAEPLSHRKLTSKDVRWGWENKNFGKLITPKEVKLISRDKALPRYSLRALTGETR